MVGGCQVNCHSEHLNRARLRPSLVTTRNPTNLDTWTPGTVGRVEGLYIGRLKRDDTLSDSGVFAERYNVPLGTGTKQDAEGEGVKAVSRVFGVL